MRIQRMQGVLWAALVLGGCGSDNAGGSGSGAPDCAQYAASKCAALERCAPVLLRVDYGSTAGCLPQLTSLCQQTAALPGAALQASAVASCASAFAGASCDQVQALLDKPFCDAPGGTLAAGAACTSGYQCQSRACFRDAGLACGACQAPIAAGGGCRTAIDCPNGTTCSGYACVEVSGVGGPCDATRACAGYLLCENGTCQASPAQGAACDPACSSRLGLTCDPTSQTCESIALAADGEACGLSVACDAHGACIQGTCRQAVPSGRPCDALAGPHCQTPAECVDGWCKDLDGSLCP